MLLQKIYIAQTDKYRKKSWDSVGPKSKCLVSSKIIDFQNSTII